MKKALILTIFAALAVSSFAEQLSNRSVYIEGSSTRPDHLEYFLVNFRKEAIGTGNVLAAHWEEAAFIFRFDVSNSPYVEEDGNAFVIRISLINNKNGQEILFFHFYYNKLEEMYEHNHFLFYKAVAIIPPLNEEALLWAQSTWRNKWLYVRASFDYPITFYELKPDGLIGGAGLYDGTFDTPTAVRDLDSKTIALPGITIGAEFQFLDFLSFELSFKANFGEFSTNEFLNLGIGTQLKYSFKYFNRFVIQPYAAGYFPLVKSKDFVSIPPFAFGGGIQLSIKGGNNGAFFIDVNFLGTFTDTVWKNPYNILYPYPAEVKYRQSFLGIAVGYKYGFFDRSAKSAHTVLCECGCHVEIPGSSDEALPGSTPRTPRERRERAPNSRTFYF
ncbi:MAG: hypothetical protein LBU88_01120 [Treponema sp.]|jgi:hypothetical protein|nr:hypothetical protein [Treponema sp.]